MPRKSILVNQIEPPTQNNQSPSQQPRKNVVVVPSRKVNPDNVDGGEEIEIAAQISVPQDGGWGWVVLVCSFCCIFILDGVIFTFGSLLPDIAKDLNLQDSLIALINSVEIAIYYIMSPLASALINRFGFRFCIMTGSVICSFTQFGSVFTSNYTSLFLFYGVFTGLGCSLINMSAGLIVGFYFEKLRSLALAIATGGTSVGIMVMFPINVYLVSLAGWRFTTLLHSGLFGIIFFLGMSFRPLLSLTVTKMEENQENPTRTVTFLPSLSTAAGLRAALSLTNKTETITPTTTERLFSAVSNYNFPTAAAMVVENQTPTTSQAGPSTAAASKLTLTANVPGRGISRRQLKQVQSIASKTIVHDKTKTNIEFAIPKVLPKKQSCWSKFCLWEPHIPQARPMYRDDAFYYGKLENLAIYQKSKVETTSAQAKTGLEYQMAVSRAVTVNDLQEKRGLFTTSARRVLATMLDIALLKKKSFLLLCTSGFLTYVGVLVPYVYIKDRNEQEGVEHAHCSYFVSVIGLSNAIGRLVLGALASKIDPSVVYSVSVIIAGISTVGSSLSFGLVYQYFYSCMFGFFISAISSLRSVVLVSLYGLDKLTNATGMLLIFFGIGNLFSTPVAGLLKSSYGYDVAFYVSGFFIAISGIVMLPVRKLAMNENKTN